MTVRHYALCLPLVAALLLGGGGLHALLEAAGGCGHDHAGRAAAEPAAHCCGHDHCGPAGGDAPGGEPGEAPRPHDDSNCVVCVWMAAGAIFQAHEAGLAVCDRAPAPRPSDYRHESRAALTPLSRGPPAV